MESGERIVILGLSLTSSWGNAHATTYRALIAALAARGHDVLFLERDVPWYAENRDLPEPPYCRTELYGSLEELREVHGRELAEAGAVIVGSYVPQGIGVAELVLEHARGVTAFYDIDTPVTLETLAHNRCEYLDRALVSRYDIYFSFAGGPTLDLLERSYGSPMARALYSSADPDDYQPESGPREIELGYMGTYSEDRQRSLEQLLFTPAKHLPMRRFEVAGPGYPQHVRWPANVELREHIAPDSHRAFYNRQRFTLNLTRADMRQRGHSPSARLFEAAACGTPVISDVWPGLEQSFVPDKEILLARSEQDTLRHLQTLDEDERLEIGKRARRRVLAQHTPEHRAQELEQALREHRERRAAQAAKLRRVRATSASRKKRTARAPKTVARRTR